MNRPPALDSLFTLESLLSLQGAAAACLLVPNVLKYLIPSIDATWAIRVSFIIAMLLAYVAAFLAKEANWTKWIVAFFNGFLIFASAVGTNEMMSRKVSGGFFQNWFP